MSSGPFHYREAERLVITAGATARDAHRAEDPDAMRWLADSAMKAAHVHAMLAVAASNVDASITSVRRNDGRWDTVLVDLPEEGTPS